MIDEIHIDSNIFRDSNAEVNCRDSNAEVNCDLHVSSFTITCYNAHPASL